MTHSPPSNCPLCPRLCAFHAENRQKFPGWHNAPVPAFGDLNARLLVVGLAPGLHGANRTGRPFTGDYAGIILYNALLKHGLARGVYSPPLEGGVRGRGSIPNQDLSFLPPSLIPLRQCFGGQALPHEGGGNPHDGYADGFELLHTRITNAVRCVPPENKPTPDEIKTCNPFLRAEIAVMPNLRVILSLGNVSHGGVLKALGLKLSQYKFAHGAEHILPPLPGPPPQGGREIVLLNSYHTSRYNMNTGRLTEEMFDAIVTRAKTLLS